MTGIACVSLNRALSPYVYVHPAVQRACPVALSPFLLLSKESKTIISGEGVFGRILNGGRIMCGDSFATCCPAVFAIGGCFFYISESPPQWDYIR